jgi:predicted porin
LYGVRFDAPTGGGRHRTAAQPPALRSGGTTDLGPAKLYLHYLQHPGRDHRSGLQQSNKILALGAQWRPIPQVSAKIAYYDDRGQSLNGVSGRDGHKKTLVLSAEYYLSRRTSLFAVGFNNRFSGGYVLDPVNIAALGRDAAASSTTG